MRRVRAVRRRSRPREGGGNKRRDSRMDFQKSLFAERIGTPGKRGGIYMHLE